MARNRGDAAEARSDMRTIIEPFRIRMVEPIRLTSVSERLAVLERAGYNLVRVPAREVLVDLITDSGEGTMSARQWAGLITADESDVGSESLARLDAVARDLFGYRHVFPTNQGRSAKRLLVSAIVGPGSVVPANSLLEATRSAVEASGGRAVEMPIPEAEALDFFHAFKGNMDVVRLEKLIAEVGSKAVPLVLLAVSSPAGGGQPVSMENIRAVRDLTRRHGIRLFLDCAYFAENAFFVREREAAHRGRTLDEIAREMFSLADGAVLSARKDGIVNAGGLLVLSDDELAGRIRRSLILLDGPQATGGLAGRDLEGMAVGLGEALDPQLLAHRFETVQHLTEHLAREGVPVILPPGGHALHIDARAFLPHLDPVDLPGQALACALYALAGIRTAEVGTFRHGATDPATGKLLAAANDLVRFSIPRRAYTRSHVDYVIEAVLELFANRHRVSAMDIVEEGERRYVTARLRPRGGEPLLRASQAAELPPERKTLSECSHPLFEKRRSTRSFASMAPPPALLDRILQSFRWAPSCANRQPWRAVFATRSPERTALDATLMEGNEWAKTAPVLAAIAMNPDGAATVNELNYAAFDAGLATENLLLAATAEGMVAHPMAGYDETKAKSALGVPDPWRIVTLVAIGFPGDPSTLDAETRAKDERPRKRRDVAEIACFERWR